MCPVEDKYCPTLKKLKSGEITDRRESDLSPDFPSEFTYT
jgi:hypothetical protein